MPNYTRTPERELPLNPRLPLIGVPNQRAGDPRQDSRLINGYAEQGLDGRWHVFKRPGLSLGRQPLGTSAVGLGLWAPSSGSPYGFWESSGQVSIYVGDSYVGGPVTGSGRPFQFTKLYLDATTFGSVATDGVLVFLLGPGSFDIERLELRETVVVLSCSTTNTSAVVTTTSTAQLRKYSRITGTGIPADTEIASIDSAAQFTMTNPATATATNNLTFSLAGPPAAHEHVAFLNQRLYMFSGLEGAVYGTDTLGPTAWDWLNVIYAYARAEAIVGIATQLSTVVVYKETTTEFFRDQGTTPTSLGRVEGLFLDVGLADSRSLVEIDDTLLWSARQKSGVSSVWMMTKLGAREISNPAIRRILSENRTAAHYGMGIAFNGHSFYILAIDGIPAQVYDLTTGLWYQWTALGEVDWPFRDAALNNNGTITLQHRSDGYYYQLEPGLVADVDIDINLDIYPPEYDGGLRKGKYLSRMLFNADQQPGSELLVRVADEVEGDAEPSWSEWRRVDLGHSRPTLDHCGTFTKRRFHFRHSARTPCHLHEVELEQQICLI